jgi:large subunit ribosomal protein L22
MEVTATTKFVRMPASKAKPLVGRLRGLPVNEALRIAQLSEKKAAGVISKTLKSAIANAENNAKLAVDELRVKDATIDEGPMRRAYWPRARGMVRRIKRKTCHVKVVLTDGTPEP